MDALVLAEKLARQFEGCRLTAYQDSASVWTIGWGHTFGVKPGDIIDQERADYLLGVDMAAMLSLVPEKYGATARAALADFAYNLGPHALRQLLAHPDPQSQFDRWVHAGGQVLQGLVKRRAVEAFLFSLGGL
jgi:lysozyme